MDVKDLLWLVVLLPLITNAITTLATGNTMLGAIAGIIPAILVIKVLEGEGVDSKAILNMVLLLSILPSLLQSIPTEGPAGVIAQLLPVFILIQLMDKL